MSCKTRAYIAVSPRACNSLTRLAARASVLAVMKSGLLVMALAAIAG